MTPADLDAAAWDLLSSDTAFAHGLCPVGQSADLDKKYGYTEFTPTTDANHFQVLLDQCGTAARTKAFLAIAERSLPEEDAADLTAAQIMHDGMLVWESTPLAERVRAVVEAAGGSDAT